MKITLDGAQKRAQPTHMGILTRYMKQIFNLWIIQFSELK